MAPKHTRDPAAAPPAPPQPGTMPSAANPASSQRGRGAPAPASTHTGGAVPGRPGTCRGCGTPHMSGCSLSARCCPGSRIVAAVISLTLRLLMRKTWFPREPSQHKGAHTKTRLSHVTPGEEEPKPPRTPAAKGMVHSTHGSAGEALRASLPQVAHGEVNLGAAQSAPALPPACTRATFLVGWKIVTQRDPVPQSALDSGG